MDYQIIIILLLNRRHLSFRYFVVARDRCTSPSCIENTVKRHACTSSDRIQKKAASTFSTNHSCKTFNHQSYIEHISLLKVADDILVTGGAHATVPRARCMFPWDLRLAS